VSSIWKQRRGNTTPQRPAEARADGHSETAHAKSLLIDLGGLRGRSSTLADAHNPSRIEWIGKAHPASMLGLSTKRLPGGCEHRAALGCSAENVLRRSEHGADAWCPAGRSRFGLAPVQREGHRRSVRPDRPEVSGEWIAPRKDDPHPRAITHGARPPFNHRIDRPVEDLRRCELHERIRVRNHRR
jgi:hypothetical protein